ncbi:MAG TPA: GIY-YIG nuclease family protein [Candidatus Bathyarchaeia archaeon]|nr:GIY-YIG nuclease family protein [Candidatus Bathyarchaeia archaeon]
MLRISFLRYPIALLRHNHAVRIVDGYGWEDDPPDTDSITRSRTKLGQLRIWRFPRSSLGQINGKDFAGELTHPGLYVLTVEGEPKAYVGESSDLRKRLRDHTQKDPKELPKPWTDIAVIGDGRSYYQSIFTDTTLRLYLEKATISHLKEGGILQPVNKQEDPPKMTASVETIATQLDNELIFVLSKLGIARQISKKQVPTDEINEDNVKTLLTKRNLAVSKVSRDQWVVDKETYFRRPGSKPRKSEKGWHFSLRTKPREALFSGKGGLIISRGRGYLIPAQDLKNWLGGKLWPIEPGKEAIDLYADLVNEKLWNVSDFKTLDLNKYRLS